MAWGRRAEQIESHQSKRSRDYHWWLKRAHARSQRRECKRQLRLGEQPNNRYNRYGGYET